MQALTGSCLSNSVAWQASLQIHAYNETAVGDDSGKRLMRVAKVHGQALPGSKWPVLHLTSLVGPLAPTSVAPASVPEVVNWSACTVFFE